MQSIIKRSGKQEAYDRSKIARAMKKSFQSVDEQADQVRIEDLLKQAEAEFSSRDNLSVEEIQDIVEQTLMKNGCYAAAKSYILYREKRTELRKSREQLIHEIGMDSIAPVLAKIQRDFPTYDLNRLAEKYSAMDKADLDEQAKLDLLTRSAAEMTSKEEPRWEIIAGRLLGFHLSLKLQREEELFGIHSFYEKLKYLTAEGLYGDYILESYPKAEVDQLAELIDNTRNDRFTYSGLDLLIQRYLIHSHHREVLESPQEMYLGIAMHLAMKEPKDRDLWVKKFYDMMSLHKVTMATPTQANARKPYHQLSSCFIDTVPDSLDGIYNSISGFADVSKYGGGMGMYFGKVRSRGGSIRGFEGASGGVIRWIRVVNDTAVAVDQLGVRQGAVAVYLDVWHKDLPEFLQLRTNNGDDRMKAHDVFPAVCYPDLFWKMASEDLNQNWYLMDPHDILMIKGYALEDYYGEEWEKRYLDCVNDARISKRVLVLKEVVRLILKSAVETGTPFAFFRDAVNRANPNKHAGMIYCSNLCTEIAQNMSASELVSKKVVTKDGDEVIVTTSKPGNYVVCNLASLCLGNINVDDHAEVEDLTATVVRALDNVIDLNFYPVPNAKITNQKYRSIGLGVSGYHHMLAKHHIQWESEEHLQFADQVFEELGYAAVKASNELAKERGSYSLFHGSEWESGEYFERRNYHSERWNQLKEEVKRYGMRNAYVMATAPTSSTSILIGTSAGLDPVMNRFFLEEKKGAILPRVAPDLGPDTYWYYKNAHSIDQTWSVKAAGIRQRHIDQAQSFNLWITNDYRMSQLLNLYVLAWKNGVKTIYYVRSKSLDPDECESCSA
ncbi:MAG: ribonucleoside-diphosphate reductase subunit alpha [Solobacterium sp.]|jgi:ribonucleoside-diphosphate reductase alpha chain|nr:ribonucleoside-diphosphate reductase subunit alpha [Solobacterium sp.]MCH4265939.1 ribonucleoside-diphosphate reductase subunit alpha [Solobacterium sp.]